MSDEIFQEPMRDLMLTMSAWRRLYNKAKELENEHPITSVTILHYLKMAWDEANEDLKKGEKDLRKQVRKEAKE